MKLGGDAALMHGLMKIQLQTDTLDHDFTKIQHGFAREKTCRETSWERIVADSGLSKNEIEGRTYVSKFNATIGRWD